MNSLFLRIFLWFWAAMAVVVAVLVVSSPLLTRSHPGAERWQQHSEQFLAERIAQVTEDLEGHGSPDRREGPRGRRRNPVQIWVLDAYGVELGGREIGSRQQRLASRAADTGETISERSGSIHRMAKPITDAEGRPLVVVGELRRPPRPLDLLDPKVLVPRLTVLTLVVGLFCFGLARYLSAPVASLRGATRRLGAGDLSARVGSPVAERRDETGDLARDFDAMAERIEHLVASQQRLLRDVSHELRSPLARLEVALELARQRAGEGASGPLERIGRESKRLEALIDRLLSLERLEAASDRTAWELVDLAEVVESVVADARFEAEAKGVEVAFRAEAEPAVRGSRDLLLSAVDNVVRNAVAHSSSGRRVEVELVEDRAGGEPVAVIRVRDSGPGVPDDELERVFEPFYRVEDARDRATGGAGLGLAITRRAARAHGGEVAARNHPDGGLEVAIRLPAVGD